MVKGNKRKGKGGAKAPVLGKVHMEFPLSGNPSVPRGVSTTRNVWQLLMEPLVTSTVTNAAESNVPVGSQFANVTLAWSLRSFYEASDPTYRSFDMFRIKRITVYATLPFAGPGIDACHTIYASVDLDDIDVTNWQQFSSRSNSSMCVLRNAYPTCTVASFAPKAILDHSASDVANPSNLIPQAGQWCDVSALSQKFGGLKIHLNAPSGTTTSVRFYARAEIEFRGLI
jgi:hypothetical protein